MTEVSQHQATKMKFYANIIDQQLVMSDEQQRLYNQHLATYKPTDIVELDVKKYRQPKSNKQLGAWWGLFNKIVLANFEDRGWDTSFVFKLSNPTGIEITPELLKEYLYAVCPSYDENGNRITMRKMNTGQMAKFFDDCRKFAASQWSIDIPDPDPNWRDGK